MEFDVKRVLLALLISTSEPLEAKEVQRLILRYRQYLEAEKAGQGEEGQTTLQPLLDEVPTLLTTAQFRTAMEELQAELEAADRPYRIVEGPGGFRLVVADDVTDWVRFLRDQPPPQRLSGPALETLAIVAYRQPVTRAEVEAIRGVASDAQLSRLVERQLVVVTGRADQPGRPLQYGTTDRFLELCGLRSIGDLPATDVVQREELSKWLARATGEVPGGEQLGLLESEEG